MEDDIEACPPNLPNKDDHEIEDEDQRIFLSRLEELRDGGTDTIAPPPVQTRLNFGMQEVEEDRPKVTLENSIRMLKIQKGKQQQTGKSQYASIADKGYAGCLRSSPTPPSTRRGPGRADNRKGGHQSKVVQAGGEKKSDTIEVEQAPRVVNLSTPVTTSSGIIQPSLSGFSPGISSGLSSGLPVLSLSNRPQLSLSSLANSHLGAGAADSTAPRLSLGALAGQHLSSSSGQTVKPPTLLGGLAATAQTKPLGLMPSGNLGATSTGLSQLGQLASSHLAGQSGEQSAVRRSKENQPPTSAGGGPSLSSLASLHLSGDQPPPPPAGGSSLSSLASLHLSGDQQGQPAARQFTIPALFGSKAGAKSGLTQISLPSSTITQPSLPSSAITQPSSSSLPAVVAHVAAAGARPSVEVDDAATQSVIDDVDIDLMSALKPRAAPDTKRKRKSDATAGSSAAAAEPRRTVILVVDMAGIRSSLATRHCSSLGRVIVCRWRRKCSRQKMEFPLRSPHMEQFRFNEPSPDDIVRKAQSQSRSFQARSSPSPVRRGDNSRQ